VNVIRVLVFLLVTGCVVPKKKYDALDADLAAARETMKTEIATRDEKITTLEAALAAEQQKVTDLEGRIAALETEKARLEKDLSDTNAEKAALVKDRSKLQASVAEMEQALTELQARKAAAEQRVAEFKDLLKRFEALIREGRLRVKIVDGRMVVELPTDILFASGKADLSPEGKTALTEVGKVLGTIPERSFQVEGHTDNVPIATDRFPSNWELASARAITVVRTLMDAGVPAGRISAASYADNRPAAPNDTPEGKAANRRIEIVVVPDLSDLPGTEELEKLSGG
jgi:chemotaxis protein MotB